YRGLMVHMRPTNAKLRNRAAQMVVTIVGCDQQTANDAMARADGNVKLAVLLASGADMALATSALARHDGNLRFALAEITPRQ
ncbi:MAG TPA: hypothetical protein PLN33_10815, partial [Hyphomonadaceae bacterium]|nr:hypothetical protein [Hyphomonadaceae bacterium]